MSAPRLRDWTPEDEPAIEALWRRVFPNPRGGQTPGWLFRTGPAGPAVRVVAELDGRLVSHAGVSPARFRVGGESVRGAWSVAAMTDPAVQGQGLYVQLGHYLYERLEREGFAFVAGFSNRRSHRLMRESLGRTGVDPFPWCVRPLLPGLSRSARGREEGLRVIASEPGDGRLDGLWKRLEPCVRTMAVRDAAFSAFRFGGRPDASFECSIAEAEGGTAAGALVLRVLAVRGLRFGFVVDLLVDPDAPVAGMALLHAAAGRTRAAGGVALSALMPGHGPARQALRRAGFLRVPEPLHPQAVRFSVRGLGRFAGCGELLDPGSWWLSWADTDLV